MEPQDSLEPLAMSCHRTSSEVLFPCSDGSELRHERLNIRNKGPYSVLVSHKQATKMDTVISVLVLSLIPQLVAPQATSVTSYRAVAEMVLGNSRIFSGENIRMKCTIPDVYQSAWRYLWFRESEQLPQSDEHFFLWKAEINDSGKYYCQGERDTVVGKLQTLQSLPVEVHVDGGWAIIEVLPQPALVGHRVEFTCHVRGIPPIREVILYKEGVEVMRQVGLGPRLSLTNLTTEDQGMYSCRASWDTKSRTYSVISVPAPVLVLDILSKPVLEIVTNNNQIPSKKMKLVCHHKYNAPAPAPPLHYYFYKNNKRLGTAASDNWYLVQQTPGQYSCKVRVPELNVIRWSEPKSFEEVAGIQTTRFPNSHAREWTLAPTLPSPDVSPLPTTATATQPSLLQSTASPTLKQPRHVATQPARPPYLEPTASTQLSTVPATVSITEKSDDVSGSGDIYEYSGDMPLDFEDDVVP